MERHLGSFSRLLWRGLVVLGVLGVSACSSLRPWINEPMQVDQAHATHVNEARDPSLVMAVTISGGGARAAAFGYGVLRELQAHQFEWRGKRLNLLDAVDVISGVSGGSIVAAYYAAFGESGLPRFEQDFLRQDIQQTLLGQLLVPGNLVDLTSPWFGRSHLLQRRFDQLFQGKTFADLEQNPRHPQLIVTATDLSRGTAFEFTWDQFTLICSDLSRVPLSFAVAASSAVPLLLSPMTVKNHAHRCPPQVIERVVGTEGDAPAGSAADFRRRLYLAQAHAYLNAEQRPYIHLVDGGLADNLGVQQLLDRALTDGGLRQTFREVVIPSGSIHKVVMVVINAEREPAKAIDTRDVVPGTFDVVDAMLFGAGARAARETQEFLRDVSRQWRAELRQHGERGHDVFAPNAQTHVVTVNLRDAVHDGPGLRLMQVPTAFSVSHDAVTNLIEAGRRVLRESPDFRELVQSLRAVRVAHGAEPGS